MSATSISASQSLSLTIPKKYRNKRSCLLRYRAFVRIINMPKRFDDCQREDIEAKREYSQDINATEKKLKAKNVISKALQLWTSSLSDPIYGAEEEAYNFERSGISGPTVNWGTYGRGRVRQEIICTYKYLLVSLSTPSS